VVGIAVAVGWRYRARIAQILLATVPKVAAPKVPLAPVITPAPVVVMKPVFVPPPATVASAVAKVNNSVVSIEVAIGGQTIGGGSGFFISRSGLLLTNKHVIDFDGATFTVVTSAGTQYPAVVVAKDPTLDIALLQVETTAPVTFSPVTFGDSSTLQLGQNVVAIGYALGQFYFCRHCFRIVPRYYRR